MNHGVVVALLWPDEFLKCLIQVLEEFFGVVIQPTVQVQPSFCSVALVYVCAKGTVERVLNRRQLVQWYS